MPALKKLNRVTSKSKLLKFSNLDFNQHFSRWDLNLSKTVSVNKTNIPKQIGCKSSERGLKIKGNSFTGTLITTSWRCWSWRMPARRHRRAASSVLSPTCPTVRSLVKWLPKELRSIPESSIRIHERLLRAWNCLGSLSDLCLKPSAKMIFQFSAFNIRATVLKFCLLQFTIYFHSVKNSFNF